MGIRTATPAGKDAGAPGRGAALEVVLVPDGGELTVREAFPAWEIGALMPAIRARLGQATGTEAGATRDRDQGAGI